MVDLTSFEKALITLKEALAEQAENPKSSVVRDGCIQRFEYCYDSAHKILRRFLEENEPSSEQVKDLSFPNLIRLGWKRKIVPSEVAVWISFRDERNTSSHTYNEQEAQEVFEIIPIFYAEAMGMLNAMKHAQDKNT